MIDYGHDNCDLKYTQSHPKKRIIPPLELAFFMNCLDQILQPGEALTVHGNVQVLGQIKQPCDQRIKGQIEELDPRRQLDNVNKIKIVKYKYRPEYVNQLPESQQTGMYRARKKGLSVVW